MRVSVRMSKESRDRFAKVLLFEHESKIAIARLEAEPGALADYQREAREWAKLDIEARDSER